MLKVGVHFGLLSERLEDQLKEQGLEDKKCSRHQKDIDAIKMLMAHNMVTDAQGRAIREKIVKEIQKSVVELKNNIISQS